jgi:hypothetical protein
MLVKRFIAHIKLEIESESIESAEMLAEVQATGIDKKKPAISFLDVGMAEIRSAEVTRFRAKPPVMRKRRRK